MMQDNHTAIVQPLDRPDISRYVMPELENPAAMIPGLLHLLPQVAHFRLVGYAQLIWVASILKSQGNWTMKNHLHDTQIV